MTKATTQPRERTFLEAGFFGLAVLLAAAGGVLILIPLLVSSSSGAFEASDYDVGCAGLVFAAGFWGLSRLARGDRLSE